MESYAGSKACAECHANESHMQAQTAMGQAASRVSGALAQALPGEQRNGAFAYKFFLQEANLEMQVRSGVQTDTAKLVWAIGANVHGQTYLLEKGASIFESQLSRFAFLDSLDLTPGHRPATSLESAVGAKLSTGEVKQCAACHMTASWTATDPELTQATPGIQCEACHGPGAEHIRLIRSGNKTEALRSIARPSTFSPAMSIDFCGACHRTSMDVLLEQTELGVGTVRFQPYRLEKSRCWLGGEDARLSCVGCHNPHAPLQKQAGSYDATCLSCHTRAAQAHPMPAEAARRVCPKASANCTSCHMPKYNVADMHAEFTDHDIRVVRPGEKFPD